MKAIVYISGKVTGEDFLKTYLKFEKVEKGYPKEKWEVINPMKLCRVEWSWLKCMIVCIFHLFKATDMCMLPDWVNSRGAKIEHWIAKKRKLIIKYL